MTPPARSALRPPPPSSPSRTWAGMERVVPPGSPSPQKSPMSPAADTDKPLPQRPLVSRRSSSVYSCDSGYTKIIDLYTNWTVDAEPSAGEASAQIALQPTAYRQTLSVLLARRFTESSSPISPLTIPHFPQHAVSIPALRLTSEDSPATVAVDLKTAPSFVDFSRSLQTKRSDMVSPLSSLASPQYGMVSHDTFWQPSLRSSPEFRAVTCEYEREHLPGEVSPRITDVARSQLLPPPLELARSGGSSGHQDVRVFTADRGSEMGLSDQGSSSKFSSTPSSDGSFVVYTRVRESIRAIIRHKMGKEKESVQKGKERADSVPSIEYRVPTSESPQLPERKFSWVSSRRSSLQHGVNNLLRSLSLTKPPNPAKQTPSSSRVRQKHLAIPLTPYQKYGTAVWHNSQRKKRRQARTARAQKSAALPGGVRILSAQNRPRNLAQRSSEMLTAFQSGTDQILGAVDETKHKIARTNSEKRREGSKESVTLRGLREERETLRRLFRSNSERRREELKKSIAMIGPVDPNGVEPVTGTNSECRRETLKRSIKLVGPVRKESRGRGENWL